MVTVRDQLNSLPRHEALITTTYDFDWDILDSIVAMDRGRRKTSIVITDKDCFQEKMKTLPEPQPPWLCNSYFLNPANEIKGAFHPKVTMAIDVENLLLVTGSHNLTRSGVESNLEITSSARIPLTEPNLEILQNVADFLNFTSEHILGLAKEELQDFASTIIDVRSGTTRYTNSSFLHSCSKPILTQVLERIPLIEKTIIIAPTHSEDPQFLQEASEVLGKNLTFAIDPARFSVGKEAKTTFYEKFPAKQIRSKPPRILHAKMYVFQTKTGDWVLFGSPNFTKTGLLQDARNGGNVEAAWLIPPSVNWNWQQLFTDSVTLSEISIAEIPSSEEKAPKTAEKITIEQWGYETLDGKGIILTPGLKDGTTVWIHFCGTAQRIQTTISNGRIIFTVPPNWAGIKYEILDDDGKILTFGILNRAHIIGSGYQDYHFDQETMRELYRFMRRLHNTSVHGATNERNREDLDVPILEENLHPRIIQHEWNPYSGNFRELTPDKFYPETRIELVRTAKNVFQGKTSLRQLISDIDLILESTFFAGLLMENSRAYYQVLVSKDLSQFMNLPSSSDSQALALSKIDNWQPYLLGSLSRSQIDEWKKIGPTSGAEISLLFDYWLYYQTKGRDAFERPTIDSVLVTNRFSQIWQALRRLSPEGTVKSTSELIWESRLSVLESKKVQELGKLPLPESITELELCLQSAFQKCQSKLKQAP